jgi:hypothetical protein
MSIYIYIYIYIQSNPLNKDTQGGGFIRLSQQTNF